MHVIRIYEHFALFLNDPGDRDIISRPRLFPERAMPKILSAAQVDAFERDGFVSPVRAISERRALYYRQRLEAFEAAHPEHRLKLDQKAHMLCPSSTR